MVRSRTLVVFLLVAAAGVPVFAEETVESLAQRVQTLENRIATLERTLIQRLSNLEQKLAQGAPQPTPNPLENEASLALQKINATVAAGDYEKARTDMVEFMKTYGSTRTAAQARRLNEELAVIGKVAPATWGIEKWYQGEKDVDLKGAKTTLVVFWEEWCPHCRREVPKIQEIYGHLKGSGLQVVGVTKITRTATEEKVQAFLTEQKVAYPMAKEDGSLSQYFAVTGIPAAAVIKSGKVVWRGHPAQIDETKLKSWL